MKRLYRDKSNDMLAGVCSGIAKYLDVDATIIRLVFVLFAFMGGGGLWIYLVLWVIMPEAPIAITEAVAVTQKAGTDAAVEEEKPKPAQKSEKKKTPVKKPAAKAKKRTAKSTAAATPKAPASAKTKKKTDTEDKKK